MTEREWEARAESVLCAHQDRPAEFEGSRYPILCGKDGTMCSEVVCVRCLGIDAPKRDRSAGRASKAKRLTDHQYALELRDWARIFKERRNIG